MILRVKSHFDASHFLPGYEGKCANLHGHRFEVEVKIKCRNVDKRGITIDFKDVKEALDRLIPDHCHLNDILECPTAENIAQYLFTRVKEKWALGGDLISLVVWESPECGIEVCRGKDKD